MESMDLKILCDQFKNNKIAFNEIGLKLVLKAMYQHPHAPEPHNILGVILELQGNHSMAMKHFRAAYSLDPTYQPAKYNLTYFGDISPFKRTVFNLEEAANHV